MNLKESKKIILLGLILLVLAGIIVVALKGVNVSLMMKSHESVDVLIGKAFDIKDVNDICKEVFKDKKFVVRKVEVFEDSANISALSITDEEKNTLVDKINEKYETSLVSDDITTKSVSNVRIRDVVSPYILPVAISMVILEIYIGIRFKKMNSIKVMLKVLAEIIVIEAVISSLVAICRIPVSEMLLSLMIIIIFIEYVVYIARMEKALVKVSSESKNKNKK